MKGNYWMVQKCIFWRLLQTAGWKVSTVHITRHRWTVNVCLTAITQNSQHQLYNVSYYRLFYSNASGWCTAAVCAWVCVCGPLPRPGGPSLIYNACCSVKMLKESLTHGNSSSDGGSINESMINITAERRGIMDVSGKWIRTRGTLTCGPRYCASEGRHQQRHDISQTEIVWECNWWIAILIQFCLTYHNYSAVMDSITVAAFCFILSFPFSSTLHLFGNCTNLHTVIRSDRKTRDANDIFLKAWTCQNRLLTGSPV